MSKKYNKMMGRSVDFGDFIIIRPRHNYRVNSGIIIIKDNAHPVVVDVGTPVDPGLKVILNAAHQYKIDLQNINYIFLTHSHPDHFTNAFGLLKHCPNARLIANEKEWDILKNPKKMANEWVQTAGLIRPNQIVPQIARQFVYPIVMLLYRTIHIIPPVAAVFQGGESFQSGNCHLKIIPTPGHSPGHSSLLDGKKNLYLGDCVPFTPWISPTPEALQDMIGSIKHLLAFSDKDVHQTVRSHGDIRNPDHKKWEIFPWGEEKPRFQFFLDTIFESLEKIPHFLRRKPEGLDLLEITGILIPHYARYNKLMRYTIPPSLTWIAAYLLFLETQGKVSRKIEKNRVVWVS